MLSLYVKNKQKNRIRHIQQAIICNSCFISDKFTFLSDFVYGQRFRATPLGITVNLACYSQYFPLISKINPEINLS